MLTVVAFGIYKSTRGSAPPPPPSAKKEINLGAGDRDVLEKSLYNESTKVIDDMKSQMEDLQKQLKAVQETKERRRRLCLSPIPAPARACPGSWRRTRGVCRSRSRLPCRHRQATHAPLPPGVPPSPVQQPGMRTAVPGAVGAPQARGLRGHQGRLPGRGRRQERC